MIYTAMGTPVFNEELPKRSLLNSIQSSFKFDLKDRISVRADVNQFKAKEDESVWLQAKGRAPNYLEVYWDDVWLFDFSDNDSRASVILKFWTGFKNAFESGQIHLYTPTEMQETAQKDRLDELVRQAQRDMSEKTESDRIAKQVVLDVLEEKKKKRDKVRKKIENRLKG